jgi:septal ring-binding cell division protein DamX
MEAPVPSFAVDTPPRKETDTVPGDRPVYVPPAAEAPPPSGPEIQAFGSSPPEAEPEAPASVPAPDASGRPSQEDLAALDELLHPSGSGATKSADERPRAERWEPQFRTGDAPSATAGPSATTRRSVGRRSRGSKAPILAGIAGLVIAGSAAGYFLLGRTSTPTPSPQPSTPPTAAPTPALSAPATVAAAPSAVPSPELPTPTAAAGPAATPVPAAPPTPAPTPVPAPVTAPAGPGPAASYGEARALLRQGALAPAAQGFASSLAAAPDSYSIQTLVACSPENVQKAVNNVAGDELFVLPVNLDGRSCYRVCWGVFDSQAAAEAALPSLPPYFQKGMVQPLASLLP